MEEIRKKIDIIDQKIAKLFEERIELVKKVAIYKNENNLPILDKEREKLMLEKNISYLKNEELTPYYIDFLKQMLTISKKYQNDFLKGLNKYEN